jgi:hypothetical protein
MCVCVGVICIRTTGTPMAAAWQRLEYHVHGLLFRLKAASAPAVELLCHETRLKQLRNST